MKSSNSEKTNQQKWYAPKQRFSIRKYHFGAASVLLGISLAVTGGEVAEATEITSTSTSDSSVMVETQDFNSTPASTEVTETATTTTETTTTSSSPVEEVAATTATASATSTVATTAATVEETATETATTTEATERTVSIAYIIQYVLEDGTVVSATAETTSVTTTDAVAKATVNLSANVPTGYELVKGQAADLSQEVNEGTSNTVTFKVVKKAETTTAEKPASATERAAADQPASTTDADTERAATATKEVELAAAKVVLEQKLSEATVLAAEADRTVATASSDTAALKAAASATKMVVSEATEILNNAASNLDQINARIDAVRTNVEALALELRKYSKDGEIQVRLAVTTLVNPKLTVVANVQSLTDEEVAAIKQAVKNANPSLTENDTIKVIQTVSSGYAGAVTVYFGGNETSNTGTASIASTDVIIGTTGTKNKDQLKEAINWFDFAAATITYSDGTKVGPLTGYDTGTGIPLRTVTYTDGSTGLTTDQKFKNLGVTKYVNHIYYTGGTANTNRLYEVLQEGMTFIVPTKVEGYVLTATVQGLGSKEVDQDPNQSADGTSTNAMFNYGDWTAADVADFQTRYANYQAALAAAPGTESSLRQSAFDFYFVKVTTTTVTNTATGTTTTTSKATNAAGGTNNQVSSADIDAMNALTNPTTTTTITQSGTTRTETTVRYKKVLRGSEGAYVQNINRYGSTDADVILMDQDSSWSYMKVAGFASNGLVAFGASVDTSNVGVTFGLSATYNGQPVAVNVIATDAEEAGTSEFVQFESDGTPWEEFMTLAATDGIKVPTSITQDNLSGTRSLGGAGYDQTEFTSATSSTADMYGKQTFGPVTSGGSRGLAVGISENVSTLSIYVASAGTQQAAMGFVVYDSGDAPASYGNARHLIGDFTTIKEVNGVNTQVINTQPYLGNIKADPDFQNTDKDKAYWTLDDVVYTEKYTETELKAGNTVTNADGQSGTFVLTSNNTAVLRFSDGSTRALKQGEIISTVGDDGAEVVGIYNATTKSIGVGALPDEGEPQLLDEKVSTKYNIRRASDTSFVLEGVEAHVGQNNSAAYIRGWVDFDGNGQFDLYEASDVITITEDGTVNIVWNNVPQLSDTSQDWAGVRLRIGLTETEILTPTGTASSGEVEDFQAFVTHLPRGHRAETSDYQDKVQTYTAPLNAYFTANGKDEDTDFKQWAQIDSYITPQIVVTEASVATATPTGTGQVNVTDESHNTAYIGTEVKIYDANNKELGTAIQVTNPLNGTTEYYLTNYTEYDTAGNKVGVYTVSTRQDSNGMSHIDITFDPEPGYVGTAKGIAVRAWDTNNNSTGWRATAETIESSVKSTTLADKDKIYENVNNGNINTRLSMDSTYIPTVIDVRPVGEDEVSEDVQGATQTGRPTIPTFGTVETGSGADASEIYVNNKLVILDDSVPEAFGNIPQIIPGKVYEEDTKVTEEVTIQYPGGKTVTYAPQPVFTAGTSSTGLRGTVVTGTGFTLDNVRFTSGTTIPAGAKPTTSIVTNSEVSYTTADGQTLTAQAGGTIPAGATVNGSFVAGATTRYDNIVFNTGDTVSYAQLYDESRFATDTTLTQIVTGEGTKLLVNSEVYTVTNDTVPKGTTIPGKLTYIDYASQTLPNATHLDPVTGAISSVPRSVTTFTDTKIVIAGEGTYTLDPSTGIITFVPEPTFVGKGTGVYVQQPDIDYNDVVTGDPVTSAYGKDYGSAKYTPTVNPATTATISRTIHYVFDNDNDPTNNATTPVTSFGDSVVNIDNQAVTKTQTLTFTREFSFDSDGNLVVSDWKPINDANQSFDSVISPVIPGYTATVIPVEHRAANNIDAGVYTPAADTIMSDDTDNIDVYVVYTPNKQYAAVKYWDVYTGEPVELKTETVNDDATLSGVPGETIQYKTAQDIAAFEKEGYQLVFDAFTIAEGRTFDTQAETDPTAPSQVYNVYFTHKTEKTTAPQKETVTRTIKYVDESGNPVLDANGTPVPDHVETLTFEREVFIDLTLEEDDPSRITYGPWKVTSATDKFAIVPSPEVPNYTTPNTIVEGTATIDPLAEDQIITVVYKPMTEIVVPPGTKPTDPVPGTGGKTYGELGLIEEVTLTVNHVYADGTPVEKDGKAVVSTETLTFTRTVKLDGNTGEIITATYGDWTPATQNFTAVPALTKDDVAALENYLPSVSEVTRTDVVATDKDTEATIIYRTGVKVVDPKDPDNNPDTPTPETPVTPDTPVPNDPKGRTYGELGLVEEVTLTVNHVYADGSPVYENGQPVVTTETLTFTRTVQVDAVTGDIIADTYTAWTPATQDFTTVKALTLDNYTSSVPEVAKTGVVATDKDVEATIIYTPINTDVPPKTITPPTDVDPNTPVPNDPKGRTYGELGLVEQVTRTVNHLY
ncbi:TPA: GEVED domain-containing protein, partial [Streptococcus suis]